MASSLVSENLYPVFRATEMKTDVVRVRENFLFPNHALRPELDALMMAKPDSTPVSDWSNASNERLLAARCRSAFMTGDSETIWAHYTGLVDRRTSSNKRRQLIDRLIRGDRYLRLAPRVIVGSMQAFSCQRGGFLALEDITACAFKRDSKLIWSEPLAGVFRAGAAATRHILPGAKIDVVVFPANFRRYSQAKSGFVVSTREFCIQCFGRQK
jgi:hypothetical protein